MAYKTFEDLPVWQAGRELVRRVYDVTRRPQVARDHGFCDQIERAAVSVTNNISEGHERGTTVDLVVSCSMPKAVLAKCGRCFGTPRTLATCQGQRQRRPERWHVT